MLDWKSFQRRQNCCWSDIFDKVLLFFSDSQSEVKREESVVERELFASFPIQSGFAERGV